MKTYCVVQSDGKSYLVQAVSIFEVDSKFYLHEAALRVALMENRPLSLFYFKGTRDTRNIEALPLQVGSITFKRV